MSKIFDKIKVSTLLFLFIGGVVVCAVSFYFLSKIGHGFVFTIDERSQVTLLDSVYFSIVTVSSLGYGDYRPVGIGRIVAVFEVLYGLVFLALIVSKLASDKISSLIRITYAGQIEARIMDYVRQTQQRNDELLCAIGTHDHDSVKRLALELKIAFTHHLNYVAYQEGAGGLEGEWAARLLLRLLRIVSQSVPLANKVIRTIDTDKDTRSRLAAYADRACKLANTIKTIYPYKRLYKIAEFIYTQRMALDRLIEHLNNDPSNIVDKKKHTPLSEEFLLRVKSALPKKPWKKHMHKTIASQLGISNRLAHSAISELVKRKMV